MMALASSQPTNGAGKECVVQLIQHNCNAPSRVVDLARAAHASAFCREQLPADEVAAEARGVLLAVC